MHNEEAATRSLPPKRGGMEDVVPNSVGWYILEGYPWWPVYICDVFKLRPTLHILGSGHRTILKKARDFPHDFTVVYYFGSHDFSLVGLKKGVLRAWNCAQKKQFLKGHPKHLTKKKGTMEELVAAIHEAEEYLSQPEDIRIPPHMVPSDLDPTLEPPPPELKPQEMDLDNDLDNDVDDDLDEEDEKRDKTLQRDDKGTKKRKKDAKKMDDRKRKSNVPGLNTSPKVAKTIAGSDVTSQVLGVPMTRNDGKKEAKKRPSPELSVEALSIILEKEIRWILVNCPFEEMTTKTVRKLLEDRLHMDLRHHKASIKEGVARVISSMEDEEGMESTSPILEAPTVAAMDCVQTDSKHKESARGVVSSPHEVGKHGDEGGMEAASGRGAYHERTRRTLETASTNLSLALDIEATILDVLDSLTSLDHVDKNVLATSTLYPRLVHLRAHRSSRISNQVAWLVQKWQVEALVPAPQPMTKELLELKAKLEHSETSHAELAWSLKQLGEMPLTIDHLKKTGISRAVSKLRQHGNDKVSARAHELRQKWMKQSNDQTAENDAGQSALKTLDTLNRVLDHHSDDTSEHTVQSKQLAALDQLYSMSLDTQDIIDSKVGISVSKLRKSSNENVAKLAKKLRKKWQAEAKANAAA